MNFILYLSQVMIPLLILYIVGFGLISGVPVYDCFIRGAKEGLNTVVKILPSLIGLMTATGVLRASGLLDWIAAALGHIFPENIFPSALIPLSVVRLFSSSAATGLLLDLYKEYGTDSRIGLTASLMMCCTETVFYTMSIYFSAAGIKKTRHTLCGALLASLAGMIASIILTALML